MTTTVVDELTALDWETGAPCQGTGHFEVHVPRGDARWVQHGKCPRCGMTATPVRLCEGGRLYRLMCDQVRCSPSTGGCGKASPTDAWGFRFDPIKDLS
jgi:hypothetical protein